MKLIFSDYARKIIAALDKPTRKTIGAELRKFQDKKPVNIKKVKSEKNTWRIAAGDWRVILEAGREGKEKVFHITDVILRKDAYR